MLWVTLIRTIFKKIFQTFERNIMLTQKEKELVLECLEGYPAGVTSNAWGHGPMDSGTQDEYDERDQAEPSEFNEEQLREFG